MKYNPTGSRSQFAFGFGSFGSSMVYALLNAYLLFFLTQVEGLSGSLVGTFLLVVRIFDALNDPIMGSIVYKTRSKYGKYRLWALIGALLTAVFFVLLFLRVDFSIIGKYFYYFSVYILLTVSLTIMDIPYWSLIPALTHNEGERNNMSAIAQVFTNVGTILVTAVVPIILAKTAFVGGEYNALSIIAIVASIILLCSMLVTFLFVREKNDVSNKKISYNQMFSHLFKNGQALAMMGIVFFSVLALNLTIQLGVYFFNFDIGNPQGLSVFMVLAGIGLLAGIITYPFIVKKVGRKAVFIVGCILCAIGYALMFTINALAHGNIIMLSLFSIVALLGLGWIMVGKTVMLASVSDFSERKFGEKLESVWASMSSFTNKTAIAVAGFIVGLTLDFAKMPKTTEVAEVSADSLMILRAMMFIVPIIFICLALMIYMRFYKLDQPGYLKQVKTIEQEKGEQLTFLQDIKKEKEDRVNDGDESL